MIKTNGKFYIGRTVLKGKTTDQPLLYDPDDLTTHAENVLGLLTGSRSSRRVSTSLTKRRLTAQAKADIEESVDTIEELEADLAELAEEIEDVIEEVENKWADIASEIDEIPVTPFKKDILIDVFGVAWVPYHVVEVEGKVTQSPGFKSQ